MAQIFTDRNVFIPVLIFPTQKKRLGVVIVVEDLLSLNEDLFVFLYRHLKERYK